MDAIPSNWLAEREQLRRHRHELTAQAARRYPADARVAGTPLLSAPGWIPDGPIPLRDIAIEFRPDAAAAPELGPPTRYAETMSATNRCRRPERRCSGSPGRIVSCSAELTR
jgi:hypothetical protein